MRYYCALSAISFAAVTLSSCGADDSSITLQDSLSQPVTAKEAMSEGRAASQGVIERRPVLAELGAPKAPGPGIPPAEEGVPGDPCAEQLSISGPFTTTSNIVGGIRYTLIENINGPAKSLSINFRSDETGLLHLGAAANQDIDTCDQCITFFDPDAGEFWVSHDGFLDVSAATPPLSGNVDVELFGVRLQLAASTPNEGPVEGSGADELPHDLCITNVSLSNIGEGCEHDDTCKPEPKRPRAREVTYESDIQPLLSRSCAGNSCHSAASSFVTLVDVDLDTLVDIPSTQLPNLKYITPDSSSTSYLWMKIANSSGIDGVPMPFNAPALDSDTIDLVAAWIDAGAP